MSPFAQWFFGLFIFSLGIGWLAIYLSLKLLRSRIEIRASERNETEDLERIVVPLDIPNWVIGLFERTFFTILVASNISGTSLAMIAWIALKMLSHWNMMSKERENITIRSLALSGLIGNLLSMLFALIGGLICRGAT
jgi:hypothetical protein